MERINVLVVEDERLVAEDLKQILSEEGYNVVGLYSSGEKLLENIESHIPDIILMDIKIKGKLDGVETSVILRQKYDIPIVYLTAHADQATLDRVKITEPYGYVLKPFERREIHTSIQIAVYRHKMEKEEREKGDKYKSIIKSIGDAVIVADRKGYITYENSRSEELTGFDSGEIKGKNINDFFKIIGDNSYDYTKKMDFDLSDELALVNKRGERIPIYENATPVRDKEGNITGIVMTFHRK